MFLTRCTGSSCGKICGDLSKKCLDAGDPLKPHTAGQWPGQAGGGGQPRPGRDPQLGGPLGGRHPLQGQWETRRGGGGSMVIVLLCEVLYCGLR